MSESENAAPAHRSLASEGSSDVPPKAGVSRYVRTLPFTDMPGKGRNDAVRFGTQASWGFAFLSISVLTWFTPKAVNANREDWEKIESAPFSVLAVGILIGALFLFALAVHNLGQHLSHSYALQVAVARNLKQLEGFDVNGMKLHESAVLEVEDSGSSMRSDRPEPEGETS